MIKKTAEICDSGQSILSIHAISMAISRQNWVCQLLLYSDFELVQDDIDKKEKTQSGKRTSHYTVNGQVH